jgi:hypothetical protein
MLRCIPELDNIATADRKLFAADLIKLIDTNHYNIVSIYKVLKCMGDSTIESYINLLSDRFMYDSYTLKSRSIGTIFLTGPECILSLVMSPKWKSLYNRDILFIRFIGAIRKYIRNHIHLYIPMMECPIYDRLHYRPWHDRLIFVFPEDI